MKASVLQRWNVCNSLPGPAPKSACDFIKPQRTVCYLLTGQRLLGDNVTQTEYQRLEEIFPIKSNISPDFSTLSGKQDNSEKEYLRFPHAHPDFRGLHKIWSR
jgi:hypothetical protein